MIEVAAYPSRSSPDFLNVFLLFSSIFGRVE
jgi:hypothetical protein